MIKTKRIPRCQRHPGISSFQTCIHTIQQNRKKPEGARKGVAEVTATELANTWLSLLAIPIPPPHSPVASPVSPSRLASHGTGALRPWWSCREVNQEQNSGPHTRWWGNGCHQTTWLLCPLRPREWPSGPAWHHPGVGCIRHGYLPHRGGPPRLAPGLLGLVAAAATLSPRCPDWGAPSQAGSTPRGWHRADGILWACSRQHSHLSYTRSSSCRNR